MSNIRRAAVTLAISVFVIIVMLGPLVIINNSDHADPQFRSLSTHVLTALAQVVLFILGVVYMINQFIRVIRGDP